MRAVACSRAEWSSAAFCIWESSTTSELAAWRKTLDVFDERQQRATTVSLFPEDRPTPADAVDTIQVKLSEMRLRRARPYSNCRLGCELWRPLELDRFWELKLPGEREDVGWPHVLELMVMNRLMNPGSELLPGGAYQFPRGIFIHCGPAPFHGSRVFDDRNGITVIRNTRELLAHVLEYARLQAADTLREEAGMQQAAQVAG